MDRKINFLDAEENDELDEWSELHDIYPWDDIVSCKRAKNAKRRKNKKRKQKWTFLDIEEDDELDECSELYEEEDELDEWSELYDIYPWDDIVSCKGSKNAKRRKNKKRKEKCDDIHSDTEVMYNFSNLEDISSYKDTTPGKSSKLYQDNEAVEWCRNAELLNNDNFYGHNKQINNGERKRWHMEGTNTDKERETGKGKGQTTSKKGKGPGKRGRENKGVKTKKNKKKKERKNEMKRRKAFISEEWSPFLTPELEASLNEKFKCHKSQPRMKEKRRVAFDLRIPLPCIDVSVSLSSRLSSSGIILLSYPVFSLTASVHE